MIFLPCRTGLPPSLQEVYHYAMTGARPPDNVKAARQLKAPDNREASQVSAVQSAAIW
jgi:hypothetical protein